MQIFQWTNLSKLWTNYTNEFLKLEKYFLKMPLKKIFYI